MTSIRRGVAIVGASEQGIPWTEWLLGNLRRHGYPGEIWPVNPKRASVHGIPCLPSVDELPAVPDLAVLVTGPDRVLDAMERLIGLGCRRFAIVSNGFGEQGTPDGRARDARLRELCDGRDLLVVGPNCVGFALFHEQLVAISEPIAHGAEPGDVSVVSQSGGLTAAAVRAVLDEGLGFDFVASLGNGTVLGTAAAIRFAVSRPTTRVVLGVVETLADRDAVEEAAAIARHEGKLIALLLLGASDAGRRVAASHTGAVVSEQRTTGTWLRSLGIVTAASVGELARIAALARALDGDPSGAFVATLSGGGAALTADLAARHRVPLATVAADTEDRLRAALPPGAAIGNPLDINTGDVSAVYAALGDDPGVRYLIEPWQLPWPTESDEYHWQRAAVDRLVDLSEASGMPVLVASVAHQPVSHWMRARAAGTRLVLTADLELTLAALGRMARSPRDDGDLSRATTGSATSASAVVAEAAARSVLADAGLPLVPGAEARDEEEAAAIARRLPGPLAVKLSADHVAHKERVGGVILGVAGEVEVRDACAAILRNAAHAGVGGELRFLVTSMVSGPEVLVGVTRDPLAGPCLTVGIGGWAAEAGAIFGTVPLPATRETLQTRAAEWGLPMLLGDRRATDLVDFLERLGTAACGPLAGYREIELNPVMLSRDGALIVDALLIPGRDG